MTTFLKTRLGVMMFLEYIIWGAWYTTITTYLTSTLHFSGTEAGAVFGTVSVASLVSPFFVGLVADRFFATERVMAVLYVLGAVCMFLVTQVTSFAAVYGLMLAFCLCYFPTIALTNSITMQQVADPGRDFPPIRVMGTLGWIAISLVVGFLRVEAGTTPFLLGAGACIVMAVYSLVALPHTPPPARGQIVTARQVLGLDALAMMKNRSYLVFVVASVLACIPLTFYYSFTNPYLNEVGVVNAAGKMSLGQMSEVPWMFLMPLVFRVVSVRGILLAGLLAWTARYVLLAYGDPGAGMWMFYLAIILHGVCYDFFFVTGQLYTDQEAPAHLRSTAQGFITFLTYGLGMLVGSLLSGGALDYFTTTAGGEVTRNWTAFWLSSASMSLAIMLLVLFFFRSSKKIQAGGGGACGCNGVTRVNIMFIGPPGSGKGTQSVRIAEKYRIPHISTGDALRAAVKAGTAVGRQVASTLANGGLVGDGLMTDLVSARLQEPDVRDGFILDGFPRTITQADALDLHLAGEPLIVALIAVDNEAIVRRLGNRRVCESCAITQSVSADSDGQTDSCPYCGGHLVRRADDDPATIRRRLATYATFAQPLIDYYRERPTFASFDGLRPPREVTAALIAHVDVHRQVGRRGESGG